MASCIFFNLLVGTQRAHNLDFSERILSFIPISLEAIQTMKISVAFSTFLLGLTKLVMPVFAAVDQEDVLAGRQVQEITPPIDVAPSAPSIVVPSIVVPTIPTRPTRPTPTIVFPTTPSIPTPFPPFPTPTKPFPTPSIVFPTPTPPFPTRPTPTIVFPTPTPPFPTPTPPFPTPTTPTPPAEVRNSHLVCHLALDPEPLRPPLIALIANEAQEEYSLRTCRVFFRSVELCVPATKKVSSDQNFPPELINLKPQELKNDFICYTMRCRPSEAPEVQEAANQFGKYKVEIKRTRQKVCIPSWKLRDGKPVIIEN